MKSLLIAIPLILIKLMLLAMLLPVYILLGWWFIPIWDVIHNTKEDAEESFIGTVLVFIMAPLMLLYAISTLAQEGIKWCFNTDGDNKDTRKKHKEKTGGVSYSNIVLEEKKNTSLICRLYHLIFLTRLFYFYN